MEINSKKILIPILYSILIWLIAFFVIGWTQISKDPTIQNLYLPMVLIFALGTLIMTIIVLLWYLPFLGINIKEEWFQESLFFGIIITVIQFILDIATFGFFFPEVDLFLYFFGMFIGDPQGSTVLIMYPLIAIWSIIAGYITMKKKT